MTELQVKAAQLKEDIRHNKANEKITSKANKAQAKHYATSDAYTQAHYERSDTAGMVSANASAMNAQANTMNAQTNRSKYNMEYDIEYGWTGGDVYPKGMPLSAQKKSAEIEYFGLAEDSNMPAVQLERQRREAENAKLKAEALNKVTTAYTSILNSVFGKGGVVSTVDKELK